MGSAPTVSIVVIARESSSALAQAIGSAVEQDYRPLELVLLGNGGRLDDVKLPPELGVDVRRGMTHTNLGVAGGRNVAARLATGELLLFLDDDAVLRPGSIRAAVETANGSARVGAVAFRVVDPATESTAVWYYPQDRADYGARAFDVPSVVGGGNLIRRDCFEALDGFWEGYFREMEEIDFSWRLLDAGWRIRYEPQAVIEHPERTKRLYRYAVPSNVLMLWRLLPVPLALRQTLVKLPLFAVRAVRFRELGDFVHGLVALARGAPRVMRERAVLAPATVAQLRALHADGGFGKRLQWSLRPDRLKSARQPPS